MIPETPTAARALAAADVDGDGDMDYLVCDNAIRVSASTMYRFRENLGNGEFVDRTASLSPQPSGGSQGLYSAAFGDIDLDGDLDLVAGTRTGVQVYLNDPGTPWVSFTPAPSSTLPAVTASFAQAITLLDVDGNGALDIVVGRGASRTAFEDKLFLNDGTGSFTDETALRLPQSPTRSTYYLRIADVDQDGFQDIVASGHNALWVYHNAGASAPGVFAPQLVPTVSRDKQFSLAVGDVEGDGDTDIMIGFLFRGSTVSLTSNAVELYVNDGTGNFTMAPISGVPGPPTFTAQVSDMAFEDVDQDGDLDFLAVSQTAGCGTNRVLYATWLWRNNGMGTFQEASGSEYPHLLESCDSLLIADFDGDMDADVLIGTTQSADRLYLNDPGNKVFHDEEPVFTDPNLELASLPFGASNAACGDVDGDDFPDLILTSSRFSGSGQSCQPAMLHHNDGTGRFDRSTALDLGQMGNALSTDADLADVDLDGDLDLVVATASGGTGATGESALLLNDGGGNFSPVLNPFSSIPADSTAVRFFDANNDQFPDLVFANSLEQNQLFLGGPAGIYVDATGMLPVRTNNTQSVAVIDFDSDGNQDLLFGDYGGGPSTSPGLRLLRNVGASFVDVSTSFLPSSVTTGPNKSNEFLQIVVGDVNADGFPDIIGGGGRNNTITSTSPIYVLLGSSSGMFTEQQALPTGRLGGLALGDIDEDGDLDLAAARVRSKNGASNRNDFIYWNDGTGLFTEDPTAISVDLTFGAISSAGLCLIDVDGDEDLDWVSGGTDESSPGAGANRVLYNLNRQFSVVGSMRLGKSVYLRAALRDSSGPAPGMVLYRGSLARLSPGQVFPAGTLYIDPARKFFGAMGTLDSNGEGSLQVTIPPDPALVGIASYWQAALAPMGGKFRLSRLQESVITTL